MEGFSSLRSLGAGAAGTVELVRRKADRRLYALKKLALPADQADAHTLLAEAHILASLEHPHIVRYHDSFVERRQLHLVMEYAPNGSLHALLAAHRQRREPLTEPAVWRVAIQLLSALHAIHCRRIVHRDIKPQNIFLGADGSVKLGDFGVSRILSQEHHLATTVVGSPGYLSPELCGGEPYDEKADVWAVGVTLAELCLLRHPFGDAASQAALIMKIMTAAPATLPSHYSPQLARLVVCCMQREPAHRPAALQLLLLSTVQQHAIKLRIEAALASEVHRLQAAAAFRHKAVAAPPSPLPGGWAAADTLEADSARKPARHRASSPILPPRKASPCRRVEGGADDAPPPPARRDAAWSESSTAKVAPAALRRAAAAMTSAAAAQQPPALKRAGDAASSRGRCTGGGGGGVGAMLDTTASGMWDLRPVCVGPSRPRRKRESAPAQEPRRAGAAASEPAAASAVAGGGGIARDGRLASIVADSGSGAQVQAPLLPPAPATGATPTSSAAPGTPVARARRSSLDRPGAPPLVVSSPSWEECRRPASTPSSDSRSPRSQSPGVRSPGVRLLALQNGGWGDLGRVSSPLDTFSAKYFPRAVADLPPPLSPRPMFDGGSISPLRRLVSDEFGYAPPPKSNNLRNVFADL